MIGWWAWRPRRHSCAIRLIVRGQVQGVGFRPYVYRLARQMGLVGHVSNNSAGAVIEVQGGAVELETFCEELVRQLPPLAQIAEVAGGGNRDLRTSRSSSFVTRTVPAQPRPRSLWMLACATTACAKCSIRRTGDIATRSSTAPTAVRVILL